jgi:hypothetical protein
MAERWLRNIHDGEIYRWNDILAKNPDTEEVTEEQAFPEKFMTKKQKARKPKVDLKTESIPEEPDNFSEELAEEASRGLPK